MAFKALIFFLFIKIYSRITVDYISILSISIIVALILYLVIFTIYFHYLNADQGFYCVCLFFVLV
ncbi:MAG: hypothetical protein CMB93_00780 [Flammeovirgaceae bacterium]|nr:hypothetical protein [Flammeovirgaceae bacterium]